MTRRFNVPQETGQARCPRLLRGCFRTLRANGVHVGQSAQPQKSAVPPPSTNGSALHNDETEDKASVKWEITENYQDAEEGLGRAEKQVQRGQEGVQKARTPSEGNQQHDTDQHLEAEGEERVRVWVIRGGVHRQKWAVLGRGEWQKSLGRAEDALRASELSGLHRVGNSRTCDMMVTKVGDEPLHSGWKKLYTNNIATTQPQPPQNPFWASFDKTGGSMWIWHGIEAPITLETVLSIRIFTEGSLASH
ncbi:hypothetical protein B0H16DRAFT_1456040 [Mycena metata]|uniref:Uncharacterized protein n=1 Tax=Mycena metata TaxID=1033252 RepID=A0AAD7NHZ1_9AGAR|nr:hypothetical protein B0H16DRAFT_1456040 [Mycena metata]